jgi:UDP-N-acetylglucosamine 2-epimerase (non-hydrolysing)
MPELHENGPHGLSENTGIDEGCRGAMNDSSCIQKETAALGVPCITLRRNTERPITVDEITNAFADSDPGRILAAFENIQHSDGKVDRAPEFSDDQSSTRINAAIRGWLENGSRN